MYTMANPSVNVWEIPPIGGAQIWINPQKIINETNKPDVAMFDNAPNDVSIGSFFGKIFIGAIVWVCVAALLFGALTAMSSIAGSDGDSLKMLWILLPIVWFIVWFIWNLALAGLYNIFFSKRYYNFGKMFWLIFVSSLFIFIFFFAIYALCASLFNNNAVLLYSILGFQIIFELFISINLIDFLSQPNYSASSLMGNMLWCVLSIILHLLIISLLKGNDGVFQLKIWLILASAMVAYTMTVFWSSLWDAIYYKFYEWWNNPFYLPSLNELREERQKEEVKRKEEEEEVNVDVK